MQSFQFEAISTAGVAVNGEIEAIDEKEAEQKLFLMGHYVANLTPVHDSSGDSLGKVLSKWAGRSLVFFILLYPLSYLYAFYQFDWASPPLVFFVALGVAHAVCFVRASPCLAFVPIELTESPGFCEDFRDAAEKA